MRRLGPFSALAVLCLAGPAGASEPSSGRVGSDSPTVEWTGVAQGFGLSNANRALHAGANAPLPACDPPFCDAFALEVDERGDLR